MSLVGLGVLRQFAKMVADGLVRPLIGERPSLDDVLGGLQRLAGGDMAGRVVFAP